MLSVAKNLQYFVESKQMQILRFAQDDKQGDFFRSLRDAEKLQAPRLGIVPPILAPDSGLLTHLVALPLSFRVLYNERSGSRAFT